MRGKRFGKTLLSALAATWLAGAAPGLAEGEGAAPAELTFPPPPGWMLAPPAVAPAELLVPPPPGWVLATPAVAPAAEPMGPPPGPAAAATPQPTTSAEPEGSETLRGLRKDVRTWAGRTEALLPRLRSPFEPARRVVNGVIADPAGAAGAFVAWAQTDAAQLRVLPGTAAALLLLLLVSLLRGWGDAVIAIEYPSELRGSFSVHLSRSKQAASRLPRTSSPSAAMRAQRRSSTSSRHHHYMVSRETQFRQVRAGRWWVTVDGYLQSPSGAEMIATHFADGELQVRSGSTGRLDFDFRPKDCPVDVKVLWDRKPVPDALVAVQGAPYSLRYTRGGVVRVGVGRGRHTIVVGSADRVAEQAIEVASFQSTGLVIDLGSREHLVFVGCPPAVEPYLHGDVQAAARALERDGQDAVAQRLLARVARERGHLAAAAEHFERAGQPLDAAELHEELAQWKQAARLYDSAGQLERAAEMFQAAGEHLQAGESFQRAGRHDEAADSYREAGDVGRWVESLEKSGRYFEAAQIAIQHDDWARAIRSLQLVTPGNPEYLDAAKLLVEAYQRQGHLDLATRKVEEVISNQGPESLPLETCDQLAHRLEAGGEFDRALDVLELIRNQDATWPNLATRIEGLRKRRSGSQPSPAGAAVVSTVGAPAGEAGRYEMLEEIGRGGMGIVFKARDRRLGRLIALKRLPDSLRSHPKAIELFLREARAAAVLNHPNIVTVYDAGQDGEMYYITMELLDGMPLQQILRQRGKLSPRDAAKLGLQIAHGLLYAHEQRIVHRDIKTGNLFFTRGKVVKIMDFGLAKMVEEVRRATTVIGGTPYYMAPEQSLGEAVDHRADLYALGVTFYELLTGRVPFRDGDVAFHHRHTPVPDPRELAPELPAAWAELVLELMAKSPDQRPASAAAVAERLAQLTGTRSEA
jgi:tetratricopeptide (TPR) repeat protein